MAFPFRSDRVVSATAAVWELGTAADTRIRTDMVDSDSLITADTAADMGTAVGTVSLFMEEGMEAMAMEEATPFMGATHIPTVGS